LRKARGGAELGQPRRLALVVGESGDDVWGRLGNADNDAKLIARILKSLKFDLVSGAELIDPDRAHLRQAIKDFGHSIGSETVGLFYFAGHGIQYKGQNYLVPRDAALPQKDDDYDSNFVEVHDSVLRQMQQAGGRLSIIVLDACRDHPPTAQIALAARGGGQSQGLAVPNAPPGMNGTVIMFSTAPGDIARDRVNDYDTDSPFATAFAETIIKPGIEMREAFDEIQEIVKQGTKGAQQPWISYAATGKFYFSDRSLNPMGHLPVPPSGNPTLPVGITKPAIPPPVITRVPRSTATYNADEPAHRRGGIECLMPDASTRVFATETECYAHPGAVPSPQ
jgi:uncharacterized caspase-like protein